MERTKAADTESDNDSGEQSTPWTSDTGQITWDESRGLVLIQTPETQAIIGHPGRARIPSVDFELHAQTPFLCLTLASLDDRAIRESQRLLMTAVARSENTGAIYNALRTHLRFQGNSPILMEPLAGTVTLLLHGRSIPKVYALDARGGRKGVIPIQNQDDKSIAIPLEGSFAFEILFEERKP